MQLCTPLANVIGVICCHQFCSASSCQTRNPASLDKKSLVLALLSAPHMPHDTQMPIDAPTCLYGATFAFMAPHLPIWRPRLPLWRPVCLSAPTFALMAPHLHLWHHIGLSAPHLPFGSPFLFLKHVNRGVHIAYCNAPNNTALCLTANLGNDSLMP